VTSPTTDRTVTGATTPPFAGRGTFGAPAGGISGSCSPAAVLDSLSDAAEAELQLEYDHKSDTIPDSWMKEDGKRNRAIKATNPLRERERN
jgi:hypothetical protein